MFGARTAQRVRTDTGRLSTRHAEADRAAVGAGSRIRRSLAGTVEARSATGRNLTSEPRRYARPPMPSKLDAFTDEIHRLLRLDPRLPNTRAGELIAEQGYQDRQTIIDAHLSEVRPLPPAVRTYQRSTYRPGELAQFDLSRASLRDPGRLRANAPRIRDGRRARGLAPRRRRSGLPLRRRRTCLGDGPLPARLRWPARDAGHRPRGRAARWPGQADRCVRQLLRAAGRGLGASARRAMPRPRAWSSGSSSSSRPREAVRGAARLPGAARSLVQPSCQRAPAPCAARAAS